MSLFFAALNSGSNGNCFYIGNEEDAILIDAGLSCKVTEQRMKLLGIPMQKLKAIFITHEHVDHIKGANILSKKYQLPVFINKATASSSRFPLATERINFIANDDEIKIGSLSIQAFSKHHDAADPISFTIGYHSNRIGVITDIGHACQNVIEHFSSCNIVFLEANYDEEMLDKGSYPWHLKNRISSDHGHLSNKQALDLFQKYRSKHLSHLFLSHLSKENNHPELVMNTFKTIAGDTSIFIASRFEPTQLHVVDRNGQKKAAPHDMVQPSLFK